MFAELAEWLRTPHAHDVLDDAVLGCLEDNYVMELFEDYDVEWTTENKRKFFAEIDIVLTQEDG